MRDGGVLAECDQSLHGSFLEQTERSLLIILEHSSDGADVRGGALADCAQSRHGSPPHLPIAILEQSSDRADLLAAVLAECAQSLRDSIPHIAGIFVMSINIFECLG